MRYKPGDKVLIKSNLKTHDIYPVGTNGDMESLSGSIQTIEEIWLDSETDDRVKYHLSSNEYVWTGSFLLPVCKEILRNY